MLVSSFNLLASETCYRVSKQEKELGTLCLEKSLKEIDIGESVEINGNIDNINIHYRYVRLQNQDYRGCSRPKEGTHVCTSESNAILILPKPPLNDIGLPSVPSDLNFLLPDLDSGEFWDYKLSIINH